MHEPKTLPELIDYLHGLDKTITKLRAERARILAHAEQLLKEHGLHEYTHAGYRARYIHRIRPTDPAELIEVAPDLVSQEERLVVELKVDYPALRRAWYSERREQLEPFVEETYEFTIEKDRRKQTEPDELTE